MRKETFKLNHGVIEERTYDDDDKLIEIRKTYPPGSGTTSRTFIPRRPGSSGTD